MLYFHFVPRASPNFFSAFVRPFQAEDKMMQCFNAHRPSLVGQVAEPGLNDVTWPFQFWRAEPAWNLRSLRPYGNSENPGFSSQCAEPTTLGTLFFLVLSRRQSASPMKRVAKHLILSGRAAIESISSAALPASWLSLLTPNAPMSGAKARSAEASAPLAG